MGYDLHITRKDDWSDEHGKTITFDEWMSYVGSDKSMRFDGTAGAELAEGAVGTREDSLATWTESANDSAVMWLDHGNVTSKNPDAAMRRKMFLIADALGAKLQGDEGETYDSTGEVEGKRPGGGMGKKRWWKFW